MAVLTAELLIAAELLVMLIPLPDTTPQHGTRPAILTAELLR